MDFFDISFWAEALTLVLALLLSLAFHEVAHAYAAKWQGDRTAELAGRLTFNPLAHADPIGTFILPLAMIAMRVPLLFGWAKPVPVDPRNFRNGKLGAVLVAAAGPVANLFLVVVSLLCLRLYDLYGAEVMPKDSFFFPIVKLGEAMVYLNAFLALFNLLPIPPLDGSQIFPSLLPRSGQEFYEDYVAPYGSMILLALIFTGGLQWMLPVASFYVNLSARLVHWLI